MNYRINEDLKLIREMLDMSQEDIANSISVQKRTIIRIENGENYPSDNTIEKIYDLALGNKNLNISQIKVLAEIKNNPNITKPECRHLK